MEIFINLVDKGASPKAYQKLLGISQRDMDAQMAKLSLYRKVVSYTKEIKALYKNRKENIKAINQKRRELLETIAEWNNEEENNQN